METPSIGASPKLEHQHISQTIAETFNLRYGLMTGLRAIVAPPLPETALSTAKIPDVGIYVEDRVVFMEYLATLHFPNELAKIQKWLQQTNPELQCYLLVIEVDLSFYPSNYLERRKWYHDYGVQEYFEYTYSTRNQVPYWNEWLKGSTGFHDPKKTDYSKWLKLHLNTLLQENPGESRTMLQSFIGRQFTEHQAQMDERFEAIDERFEAIDKRFEAIDKRFDKVETTLNLIVAHLGIKADVVRGESGIQ